MSEEPNIAHPQSGAVAELKPAGGPPVTLPIMTGTEGERAIDISGLRSVAGLTTLDPGYGNTAETVSSITYLNGEQGTLRYRGYAVEELAGHAGFLEVAYLLAVGELPSAPQLEQYRELTARNARALPALERALSAMPPRIHPMQGLASAVLSLEACYADSREAVAEGGDWLNMVRLLAQAPVIAAHLYRAGAGLRPVPSRPELGYAANLLHMMFAPADDPDSYRVDRAHARIMEILLILHADHGQNLSTSAVRLVGSGRATLFSSISAGILALSGPLHGGANQRVVSMLEEIQQQGGDAGRYIARAKDRDDPFRLMGFGHRVYRNVDPRAALIKSHAQNLLRGTEDPLLELAVRLESEVLADEYFIERRIYPNVDFYSGIIYRALGFPPDMFTALFALGRLPGWLAQWREMTMDPSSRIQRPRQLYRGAPRRPFPSRPDR